MDEKEPALDAYLGLSALALALVNPEDFPAVPASAAEVPTDKPLHLPDAGERARLKALGVDLGWKAGASLPSAETYDDLRQRMSSPTPPLPEPPPATRKRHGARSWPTPGAATVEALGRRFSLGGDPAAAAYSLPARLTLTAPVSPRFLAATELGTWAPWGDDEWERQLAATMPPPGPTAAEREAKAREEAAVARCLAAAERLAWEVDRWIERRKAPYEPALRLLPP